jgi:hypothetical protein
MGHSTPTRQEQRLAGATGEDSVAKWVAPLPKRRTALELRRRLELPLGLTYSARSRKNGITASGT